MTSHVSMVSKEKFAANFIPHQAGRHRVDIKFNGEKVPHSPWFTEVKDPNTPLTSPGLVTGKIQAKSDYINNNNIIQRGDEIAQNLLRSQDFNRLDTRIEDQVDLIKTTTTTKTSETTTKTKTFETKKTNGYSNYDDSNRKAVKASISDKKVKTKMEPAKDFGSFSILTAPSLISGKPSSETTSHVTEKVTDEYSAANLSSNKMYSTTISKTVRNNNEANFVINTSEKAASLKYTKAEMPEKKPSLMTPNVLLGRTASPVAAEPKAPSPRTASPARRSPSPKATSTPIAPPRTSPSRASPGLRASPSRASPSRGSTTKSTTVKSAVSSSSVTASTTTKKSTANARNSPQRSLIPRRSPSKPSTKAESPRSARADSKDAKTPKKGSTSPKLQSYRGTAERCKFEGETVRHFNAGKLAVFELKAPGHKREDVAVSIISPEKRPHIPYKVVDEGGSKFRIEFTTVEVGSYVVDVTVNGLTVPNSPLIAKAYDAAMIRVTDIQDGHVGVLSTFRVDASRAGEGQLEISINDGDVPNAVQVLGGGKCLVTYTPEEALTHEIEVTFNDEQVSG